MKKIDKLTAILSIIFTISNIYFILISKNHINYANVIDYSDCKRQYNNITISMKKGNISIIARKNKKASSEFRWKTVGFTVTRKPISQTESSISNYYPGNDVGYVQTFWYRNCDHKSGDILQPDGTYKSTYYFNEETVTSKLVDKLKLDDISHTVPLYIHFIFRTFITHDEGKTQKDVSGDLYNWSDIANYRFPNGATWGPDTKDDFYKYYNLEIDFAPGPQKNSIIKELHWNTGTKQLLQQESLKSAFIGEKVSWNEEKRISYTTQTNHNTYDFEITGYYIENATTNKIIQKQQDISKRIQADQICKSSYTVPYGGIKVHLIYNQVIEKEPNYYQFETEDGTIIHNIQRKKLEEKIVGEELAWKTLGLKAYYIQKENNWAFTSTYNDDCTKVYQLMRYYVTRNSNGAFLHQGREETVSNILKGSCEVCKDGITVHFVFKEIVKEPNYYQFEDDSGSIINGIRNKSLGKKCIGESLTWETVPLMKYYIYKENAWQMSSDYDTQCSMVYKLVGYEITRNSNQNSLYRKDTTNVATIKNGSYDVVKSGLTVHFIFEKLIIKQKPENFYQYETTKGEIIHNVKNKSLAKKKVGEILTWITIPIRQYYLNQTNRWRMSDTYNDKCDEVYKLLRYSVTSNKTGEILYQGKNSTVDAIKHGSYKVCEGGLTIHFIFEEVKPPKITPEIGNEPEITPTPEEKPKVTPTPIVLPKKEYASNTFDNEPEPIGRIEADRRGNEHFHVQQKIPSTESTYVQVQGKEYLFGYEFEKIVGSRTYCIPVIKQYTLEWTDVSGEHMMSEDVLIPDAVTIERTYAYWMINNIDYYCIESANITNETLPNGHILIHANENETKVPELNIKHSTSEEDHIFDPSEVAGVTIDMGIITGENAKPTIPNDDVWYEVDQRVGQINVKNDYVSFENEIIMDDLFSKKEGKQLSNCDTLNRRADQCNENVLYKDKNVIKESILNARYESGGSITYRRVKSINTRYVDKLTYLIPNVNAVVIHTPVICDVKVNADNDQYNQMLYPTDNCISLILDENRDLNDMDIRICNTGIHSSYTGYQNRDFSRSIRDPNSVTYLSNKAGVLRNEVIFPFDVFQVDAAGNETFVKKNTWVTLGRDTVKFHLPMWIEEGIYTVNCRSIAVNAMEQFIQNSQRYANTDPHNYVATNSFHVEVSGRIFGLNIYDISDYPNWKNVFRVNSSLDLKLFDQDRFRLGVGSEDYKNSYSYNYTVGINDSYGKPTGRISRYTFPIVNGDHPYYKNIGVPKKGYTIRFALTTTGNMYSDSCKVIFKPTFWHIDSNGKNRKQVDLYYTETIEGKEQKLVKVGDSMDQINIKSLRTGDRYLGIPRKELQTTAQIRNKKMSDILYQFTPMFNFSQIQANYAFRTYSNTRYADQILNTKDAPKISNNNISKNDIIIRKQNYYLEYYLPGTTYAVPQGTNMRQHSDQHGISYYEDFWLQDGYIIVNFDIYTIDASGKKHLSYINKENYLNQNMCCMWKMEGAPLSKTDYKGVHYDFKIGDFIMFDAGKSARDDYKAGGIY